MASSTRSRSPPSQVSPGSERSSSLQLSPTVVGSTTIKQEPVDSNYNALLSATSNNSSPDLLQPRPQPRLRHGYVRGKVGDNTDTCVCEVCQAEFITYELLQFHKLCHFNTAHVCYVCDSYYMSMDTLIVHMNSIHKNLNFMTQTHKSEFDRGFVCNICLQRFSTNKMLLKHLNLHSLKDDNYFGCKICALDFIGYRALLAHLNSPRHKEMKIRIQSIFVCVDCRSIFASRDSYAMHMMMRAQNESCDLIPLSSRSLPDGVDYKSQQDKLSDESPSPKTETRPLDDGMDDRLNSPLNLSMGTKSDHDKLAGGLQAVHPDSVRIGVQSDRMHVRFSCHKCTAGFLTQDALAMHAMMHVKDDSGSDHVTNSVRPSSAPVSFVEPASLRSWTCIMCTLVFDSCDSLAMHVMDKHAQEPGAAKILMIAEQVNRSGLEGRSLNVPSNGLFQNHDDSFLLLGNKKEKDGLRKRSHSVEEIGTEDRYGKIMRTSTKLSQCTSCKQVFESELQYLKHVTRCSQFALRNKTFEHYSAIFSNKYKLSNQIKERNSHKKDYSELCYCPICPWVASQREHLVEHMQLHMPSYSPEEIAGLMLQGKLHGGPENTNNLVDGEINCPHSTGESQRPDRRGSTDSSLSDSGVVTHPTRTASVESCHSGSTTGPPRRSRRKPRVATKMVPCTPSPTSSGLQTWSEDGGSEIAGPVNCSLASSSIIPEQLTPRSARTYLRSTGTTDLAGMAGMASDTEIPVATSTRSSTSPRVVDPEVEDPDLAQYVLANARNMAMCKYCKIIYTDKTVYYLHMGLHNLNNPWQCNLCGKVCSSVHEFTSHVIHY